MIKRNCNSGANIQAGTIDGQIPRWDSTLNKYVPGQGVQEGNLSGQTLYYDSVNGRYSRASNLRNDGSAIGINSAPVTGVLATIKALSGGSAKVLDIQNNAGTTMWEFKEDGSLVSSSGAFSAGSVSLQGHGSLQRTGALGQLFSSPTYTEVAILASAAQQINITTARTLFSKPIRLTANALVGTPVNGNIEYNGDYYATKGGVQRKVVQAASAPPAYTVGAYVAERDASVLVTDASVINFLSALVDDLKATGIIN